MDENISPSENSTRQAELIANLQALIAAGELATYRELELLDKQLESGDISPEIAAKYQSLSAPLRERLLAEENETRVLISEAEKINDELSELLAAGNIEALRERKGALEEKFHTLGVLPKNLASAFRELQRKASIAIAQHFETLDLARWESYTLKLDICNEIDKMLAMKEQEIPQCASALQALRKKWKSLGAVPKEKGEEINSRYLESSRALQNRIDSFFTAKHQAQKESLAAKSALCEEIALLADSTDWKATAEKIKAMQTRWKSLPSCGKQESELFTKFHAAADQFFSARKAFYQEKEKHFAEASRQRQELIERAKNLDLRDFKAARELREEFRNGQRAGREEENYRRLFDAAMDDFFARRKEFFDQLDSEYRELIEQLKSAEKNPLENKKSAAEICAKLRSEQFKRHSDEIEKAIRRFESLKAAAEKSFRLDQESRQRRVISELIADYLDFRAGKQPSAPPPPESDESAKVKNFRSLLEKAVSGDDSAAKKLDDLISAGNREAESIVENLEKIAGIGKQEKAVDLAAELQAAILGNSGMGSGASGAADSKKAAVLIASFAANVIVSDQSLLARFQVSCDELRKQGKIN